MSYRQLFILLLPVALSACSVSSERGTLAELRGVQLELKDEVIEDGLEKAMQSYRRFLEETPETAMTPEAIRRIADLSIEKEYGYVAEGTVKSTRAPATTSAAAPMTQPESAAPVALSGAAAVGSSTDSGNIATVGAESEKAFEKRIAQGEAVEGEAKAGFAAPLPEGEDDLDNANAEQAIALYTKLLEKYPLYERNDQVLYQMSRAYEELGQVEAAMEVMNRFVKTYPTSRYMDEVQFRRAEYYFTRKKFLDSEEAYQSIVAIGASSSYYELALYKLGWSFYKQEMYEEALQQYVALFDYKLSVGYDFEQTADQSGSKRVEDTYRVISLSFSNLGGAEAVVDYFSRHGNRSYEDKVYSHLGEFYLTKRRYSDAAAAYKAFVGLYAFHEVSPHFNMRVIEIYKQGGFGKLVVEAKKEFSQTYALNAEYWNYFDITARPDVVGYLKANLKDLANHYHALYQDKRFVKEKIANYQEALLWYRNYLASFPAELESPALNYQMAELMLENKDFGDAALAYENTAYNYPRHEKSSAAGYAAVYAYREHLKLVSQAQRAEIKQQIIRSSLKFADTYPEHEKVTIVLGAAADDLYEMKNYELAVSTAHKLIDNYPAAEQGLRRSAWLVVGHGSFDLKQFAEAENGYIQVLALTPQGDSSRSKLMDNLAASIYKQGEQANALQDYRTAANHFLRIGTLAPQSEIRPTAEYDAAAALIQLQDWERAAQVLVAFRNTFPGHKLQPEVTKKVAFVYRSAGKLELAAAEYERIERESKDEEVRRGALLLAAELYLEIGAREKELAVYRRYVGFFPYPAEAALEIYFKMASSYEYLKDEKNHFQTLRKIVEVDKAAGAGRTDRTRYLGAQAALVITHPLYDQFVAVALVKPIKENLLKKKKYLKAAIAAYSALLDYEVADVTAASTFYMAEIYYHFSRALAESERPDNLNDLEMEQYELAIEEQVYPFEDKAIGVHKKNLELLYAGIYSSWIDKSIAKLAVLFPANYARSEQSSGFVTTIDSFSYQYKKPAAVVEPTGDAPADAGSDTPVASDVAADAALSVPATQEGTDQATASPVEGGEAVAPEEGIQAGDNGSTALPATAPVEPEVDAPADADSDTPVASDVAADAALSVPATQVGTDQATASPVEGGEAVASEEDVQAGDNGATALPATAPVEPEVDAPADAGSDTPVASDVAADAASPADGEAVAPEEDVQAEDNGTTAVVPSSDEAVVETPLEDQ